MLSILSLIAAGPKIIVAALYVILLIVGVTLLFNVLRIVRRGVYHIINPAAKKTYLELKAKEAEEQRKLKEREATLAYARWQRKEAEAKARMQREEAEAKAIKERNEDEKRRNEFEHRQHRDGDQQSTPYTYKISKHGNESLAIRYGIANQEKKVEEYWYYPKGGEQPRRNPDRDKVYYEPATTIRLQKINKVGRNLYEVLLTDFRDRKAKAIIEGGTEYVKTFYPLENSWFNKHADLEKTLKGNGSFTLKELATFHVQKTVGV